MKRGDGRRVVGVGRYGVGVLFGGREVTAAWAVVGRIRRCPRPFGLVAEVECLAKNLEERKKRGFGGWR